MLLDCRAATYMYRRVPGRVLVMKDTCAHTEAPVTPRSSVIVLLSPSRCRLSPAWLSPVDLGSLADLLTRSLGSRLPYLLAPVSCASTQSPVLQLLARRVFPL